MPAGEHKLARCVGWSSPSPPVSEKLSGARTILLTGIKHEGDGLDKISDQSSEKSFRTSLGRNSIPRQVSCGKDGCRVRTGSAENEYVIRVTANFFLPKSF